MRLGNAVHDGTSIRWVWRPAREIPLLPALERIVRLPARIW
ncbi:hypothetical protein GWL_42080 [Herbaspirillum sp. GW103]|nr:hypothetical protein GWL_42080 [Herbaspirillum sp. GW103]